MVNRWWYMVWVITEAALVFSTVALWLVATEHTILNLSVTVFTLLLGVILSILAEWGLSLGSKVVKRRMH